MQIPEKAFIVKFLRTKPLHCPIWSKKHKKQILPLILYTSAKQPPDPLLQFYGRKHIVSHTRDPEFQCDICHKNTEVLTDMAWCPKRMKSSAALLQKLWNMKAIYPFPKTSGLVRWPPSLWIPGALSKWVKQPGHEIDYPPPSSDKVQKEWSYTCSLPYACMACLGTHCII